MRVGIDGRSISIRTGIGQYTYHLMLYIPKVDKQNEYVYFLKDEEYQLNTEMPSNVDMKIIKMPTNILWEQIRLPLELKLEEVDLIHNPMFTTPFVRGCKSIITVHDLLFLAFPGDFTVRDRLYFQILMRFAAKSADRIITVSEHSKQDIIHLLKISEDKVNVVYLGKSARFHPIDDCKQIWNVKHEYRIPSNFILYVGELRPRKNLSQLIKAFYKLKKAKNIRHKLVISGPEGSTYFDLLRLVRDLHLEKEVLFAGFIPLEKLPALYSAADLFVYPSLYEGFGLPPLEAMACGIPVITSNVSSLPEVVGDAAIMIDPHNVDDLEKAMYEVLTNESLRCDMVRKGLARAKMFSWEKQLKKL